MHFQRAAPGQAADTKFAPSAGNRQRAQSHTTPAEGKKQGRWTVEEHFLFLEALKIFGKEWKRVQQHVGTRSSTQARSHAQKFFVKLDKRGQSLEDFLRLVDLDTVRRHMQEAGSDKDFEDLDNYDCGVLVPNTSA